MIGVKRRRYTFLFCLVALSAFLVPAAELGAQQLFFEQPRLLRDERARFPFVASIDDAIVAIFQEQAEDSGEEIRLKIFTSENGREWEEQSRIGDPISFSGSEPNVFSATTAADGNVYVAVGESDTRTAVYRVSSAGESVTRLGSVDTEVTSVAPVISSRDDGGLVLAINRDDEAEQRIYVAASDNGRNWSEFERIEAEDSLALSFAPEHESTEDRDILVFQGLEAGSGMGYQLYISESRDGGESWSEAKRLTDFSNPGGTEDPDAYDNQRPHLSRSDGEVHLTWERRFERRSTRVFTARIDEENRARSILQVSQGLRSANAPRRFEFEEQEYYIWFEERSGRDTVVLATPRRLEFDYEVLSDLSGESTIPDAVVHNDRLHIFWQNARNGVRGLAYLEPDQRAAPPNLSGANFTAGSRAPRETAEIRLRPPSDPSGIRGYSYVWSRDRDAEVPRELNVEDESETVRLDTDEDGEWFLRARAQDRAGNWSEPETITFLRDLSPPDPVTIEEPELDEDGFLVSNTFEIEWEPSDAEHLAGYTYSFSRVGPSTLASVSEDRLPEPPDRVITTNTSIARDNIDNGTWVFRVAPIDDIGNIGEPETVVLRLNKYEPVTYVTRVTSSVDMLGRTTIEITGRGFAEGGDVTEVILDRDGEEPYDYVFTVEDDDYDVLDDRNISGPVIETIEDGEYQLGLIHPDRGLYFADRTLALEATGTVKFGDYSTPYVPTYTADTTGYALPMSTLVLWLTSILLVTLIVFSIIRMAAIVGEVKALRADVLALVGGTPLPEAEREGRIKRMKQKGVGLRVKFTAFFVTLVIAVVLLVALPLGNFILGTQQETLTDGLRERTNILLDSIVAGSVQFLPEAQENLFELNSLTFQTDPIPETLHATITEYRPGEEIQEVVWASNDPRVTSPGDYSEDEQVTDTDRLLRGETRYEDDISEDIPDLAESIEQEAEEALGDIPDRIDRLDEERIDVAVEGGADAEQEVGEIDDTITELETQQREILNEIGNVVVSVPELSSDTVLTADTTRYIFYKPIVYREIGEDIFFHGVVRVGVSSERIIGEINEAQRNLITTTAVITVIAVLGGVVGALILASIIVIP
ncbi:MAG: exo-alpha-sialidase, partial [Spirochaetota bacterium]